MQKWLVIAALLTGLTISSAVGARATEYESGFGFRISVPSVWLVLTRDEVATGADVFLGDGGSSALKSVPLAMRRVIYDRVQAMIRPRWSASAAPLPSPRPWAWLTRGSMPWTRP